MNELKTRRIWLCWKYEKNQKGKPTKVPYSASGRKIGASDKYRRYLTTYEEAKSAADTNKYNGVGFVLPDGYFLLDMDHQSTNDPLVRKMLERFSTYAEISVSGNGIHLIGKCDLSRIPTLVDADGKRKVDSRYYVKHSKIDVELYIGRLTNRFATYSGNVIRDLPVQDCTEAVLATLQDTMLRNPSAPVQNRPRPDRDRPEMSPEDLEGEAFDIVTALRRQKNGAKFIKLYDLGDISDYPSQSEADLALCSMIAYRTGNRPELIDFIFRGSALYREDKWERKDYRDATIRKAIEGCSGRKTLPDFIIYKEKGTPVLEPSLLAEHIRREGNYILVRDDAMQMTLSYIYENGCYHQVNKDSFLSLIKKPVMEFNPCLVRMQKINEAYNQLMTDPVKLTQDDLNADEDMINFRNGLLYLTPNGPVLRPHSPDVYSTIQIPCNWPGAPVATPCFDRYMEQLTNGDHAVIQLLSEVGGVVISNEKGWHTKKSLFLVGPGDTGKTVFRAILEKLLGKENCVSIDLKTIDARFGTSMLHGKRLAGSSELSFAKVNEMNTFKILTGGDTVFMEYKAQQGFTGRFNGILIFCTNRLPCFGGDNGKWVYERIMPVVCSNVIPKDQQDKMLIDKLYAEREGICYKLVMALLKFRENGHCFSEPESVIAERAKYMSENNSVIGFFTECMIRKDDGKLSGRRTVSSIYHAYREYCHENNNGYAKTLKEFKAEIADYLEISVEDMLGHSENGTCFKSYDLSEAAFREYGPLVA